MNREELHEILLKHHHCVLATASTAGLPWVSPVFFNYEWPFRVIWESARDSQHAVLVRENPSVAVVIADFESGVTPRGIYLECSAREVPGDELAAALTVFLDGPHLKEQKRTLDDYGQGKPFRLYEARPHRAYYLTQVTRDGYTVDERVEMSLDELSSIV